MKSSIEFVGDDWSDIVALESVPQQQDTGLAAGHGAGSRTSNSVLTDVMHSCSDGGAVGAWQVWCCSCISLRTVDLLEVLLQKHTGGGLKVPDASYLGR